MTTRFLLTMAAVGLATLSARAEPSARSLARHEADYRASCTRDTRKDCAQLPELASVPADRPSARTARDACDRFNTTMSTFCDVAADNPPQSREVMGAVAEVIAAKMAMVKAIAAARTEP